MSMKGWMEHQQCGDSDERAAAARLLSPRTLHVVDFSDDLGEHSVHVMSVLRRAFGKRTRPEFCQLGSLLRGNLPLMDEITFVPDEENRNLIGTLKPSK